MDNRLPKSEKLHSFGAIRRLFSEGRGGFVYPLRYVAYAESADELQAEILFSTPKKFLKRANQYAFTHESIFIVALTYGILSLSEHREMRTVKNFFRKVNALPSRYDFIMDIMHAFVQSKQSTSYHFTLIPQQRAMARGDMFEQEQMMARVPSEPMIRSFRL